MTLPRQTEAQFSRNIGLGNWNVVLSCDEIRHRSLDVHFSGTEASLQELFDEVATTDVDYHEPLLSPRTDPEQSSLARSFGENGVENSRDESTLYYQEQNIDETPNFRYQRDIQPSYNHGAGRRVKVETIDSVENQSKHQQQCLAHESYSDGGTVLLEREIPVQGFKILDQIGSGTYGKVYKVVSLTKLGNSTYSSRFLWTALLKRSRTKQ
eukprot:CAMPEP_0171574844 /NCGR_PEP_ID=MMETSP0961-20121227/5631_1 /TAXON_ID=87120 /ORGANISM="Aurantiochytrium limacinum, Strain ATCCMYA-1381" /LENGTH=210 /DNA_ID=CAMNT_0012130301 /DNA_START=39 /DNA_END=668 /DNA_ORIENTATION=-